MPNKFVDLDDFLDDLRALEKKAQNKIIRDAQREVLKPLAEDIRDVVPVDTGDLQDHIKVKAGPRRKGKIVTIIDIGTSEDNPHAARTEFGTRDQPARPVIRPLVDKSVDQLVEDLGKAIRDRLES